VVDRRPDPNLKIIDPISHKYTGKPFPFRTPEGRLALVIEIEKARYASSFRTYARGIGHYFRGDESSGNEAKAHDSSSRAESLDRSRRLVREHLALWPLLVKYRRIK